MHGVCGPCMHRAVGYLHRQRPLPFQRSLAELGKGVRLDTDAPD